METKTTTTYLSTPESQRAASDAIDAQSACNLTAVVYSLSRHLTAMKESDKTGGTKYWNHHPVVLMFVTQIDHLASCGHGPPSSKYHDASNACRDLANGHDAHVPD